MNNLLLGAVAFCLASPLPARSEEAAARQLVGPVEGSELHHSEAFDFGRSVFVTGPAAGEKIGKTETVEGFRSSAIYKAPKKSVFEIFSAYRKFFADNGYKVVFSCEAGACGDEFKNAWYDLNPFEKNPNWDNSAPLTSGDAAKQFYLAAVKKAAGGDTYVSVYGNSGWWQFPVYRVEAARPAPLGSGVVPASKIAEVMKNEGRMSFYGITFDTGSGAIKKESEPVLSEIAAFLRTMPADTFYVTGHTDDEGDLDSNMKLSRERAEAVIKDLTARGAKASMLSAHGAGPLSPVATNFTAEGRALNRRVEIVRTMRGSRAMAAPKPGSAPSAAQTSQQASQSAQQAAQAAQQAAAQAAKQAAAEAAQQAAAQAAQQAAQAVQQQAAQAVQQQLQAQQAAREKAGEGLVPVPKVTEMWLTPGTNLLVGQGFKVNRLGKTSGVIKSQDPAPNTMVRPGSTITITVGK